MTSDREEGAQTADLPDDADALKALVRDERERAQANYASWQRAAADYQNFKRRVEEERIESARLANAALVMNLLPLADDLERALQNVDTHLAGLTWVDGIRLIHRKFLALLDMTGVAEIAADGQIFDPALHEAVAQGAGDENRVLSVVQKGYRLGDRVIRPAMVVVGKGGDGVDGSGGASDESETTP